MTKHDPFLVKTIREKEENDSGSFTWSFSQIQLSLIVSEFRNLVIRHIWFISESLLYCLIFCFLIANFKGPQFFLDSYSNKVFHQSSQHIISWDSDQWLARVCFLSRCVFNSHYLCVLAVFIHHYTQSKTITQWVWEGQKSACVLGGEATLAGNFRQWVGREVERYTLLLL